MRVLSVKFDQVPYTDKWPILWRFVAETDEALPHGDKGFSGILVREGIKWKARPDISTTWSATRETREQAVESCVEDAIKLFADFEAARLRDDAEVERRRTHLANLNERLRQSIRTHDVNMHQTDKPAIDSIVLNGLSENEIRRFFGVVVESFKREDGVQLK
jgi:hypothetical protein